MFLIIIYQYFQFQLFTKSSGEYSVASKITASSSVLLKLNFIMAATKDLVDAIDYFETRENKIHLMRTKMESVLRTQLLKFLMKSVVDKIEEII